MASKTICSTRIAAVALALLGLDWVALSPNPLHAEPVVDRALAGIRQITSGSCTIVKIDFNFRIRYASHFPLDRGTELRITVAAIDPAQAASLSLLQREALRAPNAKAAMIKSIDFEANQPGGPVLTILFEQPMAFKVAPGGDFESIIVAIAGKAPSAACKPEVAPRAAQTWKGVVSAEPPSSAQATPRPHLPPSGTASPTQSQQAAALMDEARAAIRKSDFAGAIRKLTKVLSLPENPSTADAQELLGVARQKSGELAQARSEYEEYLRRYPSGESAERVRQRLSGIMTAQGEGAPKLRQPKSAQPGGTKDAGTWTVSGSASTFYIRDDSFRALRDPSLPRDINADKDAHQVHRNVMLSSFDAVATWNDAAMKSKFRFSGTEEHSFSGTADQDTIAVAALNIETTYRELGVMTRLGRQTRNTGGILGRFDGGLVSWQATPSIRLNAVSGSPVERRKDAPYKNEKLFYGASVDFGPIWGGLETSLFAIEQLDRSLLDRQAIGAEFRFLQPDKSMFATVDYDVHFGQLNAAIVSGSWTFADKSTFYGGLDYRKAPYLSAWTALQGQPFATLYDMLKVKTKEEIDQFALDRTATYQSAMMGFSLPLNNNLQFSLDATVADTSGTIASGGVDATLAPGTEVYGSAQLTGTGILTEGDTVTGALRYAHQKTSNLYVLDMSARYPVSGQWKVSPRLRLGYREGEGVDLTEYTVLPSVLLNYYWTRDLNFELEVGAQWSQLTQNNVRETNTDLFFTAGVRYDFYADGRTSCVSLVTGCRP